VPDIDVGITTIGSYPEDPSLCEKAGYLAPAVGQQLVEGHDTIGNQKPVVRRIAFGKNVLSSSKTEPRDDADERLQLYVACGVGSDKPADRATVAWRRALDRAVNLISPQSCGIVAR